MNITDIIALAKAGYKVADIKELISMAEDKSEDKSADKSVDKSEDKSDDKSEDKSEDKSDDKSEDKVDYKALFEKLDADNKKLKATLEILQKSNIDKDMSGKDDKPTDDDILVDFCKSFM